MYSPVFELTGFSDSKVAPAMPLNDRLGGLRLMLEALIGWNRLWLRRNKIPSLYKYAPSYKMKVRPFGLDTWQDIARTIEIGSGDCKDFACWRVAELREAGYPDVSPRIKVASVNGLTVYHIQVKSDLSLEDPSAILGMPPSVSEFQAKSLIQGEGGVDGIMQAQRTGYWPGRGQQVGHSFRGSAPAHHGWPGVRVTGWWR
jgi:hypothetical protein